MARHTTIFSGVLGAAALLLTAFASAPAHADFCTDSSGLPCVASGNDQEATVESALEVVYGEFIDIMLIDKIEDVPSVWWGNTINGSNGLAVTGDQYKDGEWWERIGGEFSYSGPEDIAYVTVKAGPNFAIYELSDLIQTGVNSWRWSTDLLQNKGLSHLSIWKTASSTVLEPAPLGLLLLGLTYLIWRRRGQEVSAATG